MKSTVLSLLFSISTCGIALAQNQQSAIIEDFKPSPLNQPQQEYPMVNSQGYARFKIIAPAADSVRVSLGLGGRGGTKLEKTSDGSWMGTTEGPMDEGFHYYNVKIDGGKFNDPGAMNYYGSIRWESGIEIPAHDQDFYALKTYRMVMYNKCCFHHQVPILLAEPLFIHLQATNWAKTNTLFCIYNTAGEKTKPLG
jgi:hypothetical protein